ncbi:hypothetical protein BFR57_06165 [Idiomarina sp. MD25a]|uniref:ABC transporter substrate-binding protein n=1 Tax=Idiomarina sp. MD25a TaxID=1889913 RepID=UPI0008F9565D|nr:ABC transporter substrate-binding protein [Idiomarina sp. MD25a]OIN01658.1 hypothetical protein BFR57_06165 [Idiomarina sp. MD25a]
MRFKGLAVCLFVIFSVSAEASSRWVSLNQCLDYLLTDWAPEQVVGITGLDEALITPKHRAHFGRLESILRLQPDRVFATEYNNPKLIRLLRQYTEVEVLPQPSSLARYHEWVDQLSQYAQLAPHARAHKQQLEQAMRRAHQTPQDVIILMPNQFSWGTASWADELITAMHWNNLAAPFGNNLVSLTLENVIRLEPDRYLLEGFSNANYALANEWLYHPLLQQELKTTPTQQIPSRLSSCPVVFAENYLKAIQGVL